VMLRKTPQNYRAYRVWTTYTPAGFRREDSWEAVPKGHQPMESSLFFKIISLSAPVISAFGISGGPQSAQEQAPAPVPVISQVVSVDARTPISYNTGIFDEPVTELPVVVQTPDQKVTVNVPLSGDIVDEVRQRFPNDARTVLHSVENTLIEAKYSKEPDIRTASELALPQIREAIPFRVLPDVHVSERVENKIQKLAGTLSALTGHRLVVTSGTRTPDSQAAAMKAKMDMGESPLSLYANKSAASEVLNAYRYGNKIGLDDESTTSLIAGVIQRQMDRGVYISRHLRAGAIDLRTKDLTSYEKHVIRAAATQMGAKVLLESTPPHYHLEL
jgi:hypothetical protein